MRFATVLLAITSAVGFAQAGVLDFESEDEGSRSNGWSSPADPEIHFFDSAGEDLFVVDSGDALHGKGLMVGTDFDDSHLEIQSQKLLKSMQMDLGNDDPFFMQGGEVAILTGYLGGVQVAQSSIVLDGNDEIDQSISIFHAAGMDRFTVRYDVDPRFGLIEFVDNLQYQPVPEPGTLAALALGAAGLARRRKVSGR